jgi:hypothetical protein
LSVTTSVGNLSFIGNASPAAAAAGVTASVGVIIQTVLSSGIRVNVNSTANTVAYSFNPYASAATANALAQYLFIDIDGINPSRVDYPNAVVHPIIDRMLVQPLTQVSVTARVYINPDSKRRVDAFGAIAYTQVGRVQILIVNGVAALPFKRTVSIKREARIVSITGDRRIVVLRRNPSTGGSNGY